MSEKNTNQLSSREAEIRSLEQMMADLVTSREVAFSHNEPEAEYIHKTLKSAQNKYKALKGHYFTMGIDDSYRFEKD